MRKPFYFALSLCVAMLASCTQKQGPSEQEIQERINAAVKTALEQKDSADAANRETYSSGSSSYSSSTSSQVSSSSSSSTSESEGSLEEKAYKKGYEYGMQQSHVVDDINFYLDESRGGIKSYYMNCVATKYSSGVGEENKTNRALFEEFKRGFIKGYEDGNAL